MGKMIGVILKGTVKLIMDIAGMIVSAQTSDPCNSEGLRIILIIDLVLIVLAFLGDCGLCCTGSPGLAAAGITVGVISLFLMAFATSCAYQCYYNGTDSERTEIPEDERDKSELCDIGVDV